MYSWVYKYLTTYNLLADYQFGFRKRHSTALVLTEVVDNIYHYLNEGDKCCGIIQIYRMHSTLLILSYYFKLYNYGLRGIVLVWFSGLCVLLVLDPLVTSQPGSAWHWNIGHWLCSGKHAFFYLSPWKKTSKILKPFLAYMITLATPIKSYKITKFGLRGALLHSGEM